jgi:spore coat polysaccharide biosynthesis protein SpsF (cytidylyltransferase family)
MRTVAIIQARLTSTRFPRKVLATINGETMISRVCRAARDAELVDKVVVAWAHKFPQLDENDVLSRYRIMARREQAELVVRLTSDCPLLTPAWIDNAIAQFRLNNSDYFSNHRDGFDVQVFYPHVLYTDIAHKEHVIADFDTVPCGLSVNTIEDLERVRKICATK